MLLRAAGTSFPTFDKFHARRVFLQDGSSQTINIDVHCGYQGRVGLRYKHVFSYDTDDNQMQFDNQEDKTGLKAVVDLINKDINGWLKPKLEMKPLDKEFLAYADHEL